MITQEQLATLVVRRVIFHDVPNSLKRSTDRQPTLSDVETELDPRRKGLLRKKLIDVLGSKRAYPITFKPVEVSTSPVPGEIRMLTRDSKGLAKFVDSSRKLVMELFSKQIGSVSPGLLCVIDVAIGSYPGIVLMKLERHEGAQLKLSKAGNKQTFSMAVLDDLVLTDGTRLFKSALFLRTGKTDDDFSNVVCDNQNPITSSADLAQFWMTFLGCAPTTDPRVSTQKFSDASMSFINSNLTDAIAKSDLYDALHSEMKSNDTNFTPKSFIDHNVPVEYRKQFREHLAESSIPLTSFKKDLSDINNRLRRRVYQTRSGAFVSVPESQVEVVVVEEDSITIRDSVSSVK